MMQILRKGLATRMFKLGMSEINCSMGRKHVLPPLLCNDHRKKPKQYPHLTMQIVYFTMAELLHSPVRQLIAMERW